MVELPATEKIIFLLHDVEGYTHEKIAHLAWPGCKRIAVWTAPGPFADAGIDFAHVVESSICISSLSFTLHPSPRRRVFFTHIFYRLAKFQPAINFGIFSYVNFKEILKLFSRSYVYPNNNIRSTPTWASPLYRRPLSFCPDQLFLPQEFSAELPFTVFISLLSIDFNVSSSKTDLAAQPLDNPGGHRIS